jgi:hypothetical protein
VLKSDQKRGGAQLTAGGASSAGPLDRLDGQGSSPLPTRQTPSRGARTTTGPGGTSTPGVERLGCDQRVPQSSLPDRLGWAFVAELGVHTDEPGAGDMRAISTDQEVEDLVSGPKAPLGFQPGHLGTARPLSNPLRVANRSDVGDQLLSKHLLEVPSHPRDVHVDASLVRLTS